MNQYVPRPTDLNVADLCLSGMRATTAFPISARSGCGQTTPLFRARGIIRATRGCSSTSYPPEFRAWQAQSHAQAKSVDSLRTALPVNAHAAVRALLKVVSPASGAITASIRRFGGTFKRFRCGRSPRRQPPSPGLSMAPPSGRVPRNVRSHGRSWLSAITKSKCATGRAAPLGLRGGEVNDSLRRISSPVGPLTVAERAGRLSCSISDRSTMMC